MTTNETSRLLESLMERNDPTISLGMLVRAYSTRGGDLSKIDALNATRSETSPLANDAPWLVAEAMQREDFPMVYMLLLDWVKADHEARDLHLYSVIFKR